MISTHNETFPCQLFWRQGKWFAVINENRDLVTEYKVLVGVARCFIKEVLLALRLSESVMKRKIQVNYIKAKRRKYCKKRETFIAEHKFKSACELPFTDEELADAVEYNRIISMQFNGELKFPIFQFDGQNHVYPALQFHLPQLLNSDRNEYEVCFWLYEEHAVTLKRLRPDAKLLRNITLDEVLEIAVKAKELTVMCTARPIDIAVAGNKETFTAFVEDRLTPDHRIIPEPEIPKNFWESFFDEQKM